MKINNNETAYKGIVFDLDGTLADTIEDLTDSLNVVLDYYDLPPKTTVETKRLVGTGLRNFVKKALPRKLRQIDAIVDEGYEKMLSVYDKKKTDKTTAYPDLDFVIRYLNKYHVPYAVISNKADAFLTPILKKVLPDANFSFQSGLKAGQPRKPDPGLTLKAVEAMELHPSECLYIGDSKTDYETAKNAGLKPVLVSWGFTPEEELRAYEDAILIRTPMRIIDCLKYGDLLYELFPDTPSEE